VFRARVPLVVASAVLLAAGLAAPVATAAPATAAPATAAPSRCAAGWVASWAASPSDSQTPADATGAPLPSTLDDQTLRMVVTPHLGGSASRIRLSNRFSAEPVTFGRVTVARQVRGAAVGAPVPVLFDGSASVTVPAGADVVSDPAVLPFSAFTPLAVSIFVPGQQPSPTKHWNANATSYYSPAGSGDLSRQRAAAPYTGSTQSWLYVAGVDVRAAGRTRSVVAFGDSITDGWVGATPESVPVDGSVADTNGRYPDHLQRRLIAAGRPVSVVNAGIGGNLLLADGRPSIAGPSGVQRFQQDALGQAGVGGVLVLEGINDLSRTPSTPADLIAGYTTLIRQARAAGVKIWLGTITPASNSIVAGLGAAPAGEGYRQEINTWIRSQRLADGVVDFDAAVRDPANPAIMLTRYASVDNLHPSPAGYRAMADAVDLRMLVPSGCS
jgi:lysophospholipase L1-like esterase